MTPIRTTVSFDMHAPAFGTPTRTLYATAIEMAAYADKIGVDRIGLMEHHGSEDGYLPQPFLLAAAMAAVTRTVRFILGAVILPLHDPVKISEQIAILDLVSNGRLNVIFGAGYVRSEFDMFGVSLHDRGRLLDEGIDTILRALNGERFEANDRPVFVRSLPIQKPEDIIYVGGGVPASARRAARFGVGLGPINANIIPIYEEECRRLGREPGDFFRPCHKLPGIIMLSDDPERTWSILEPHAFHVVSEYARWAAQEENSNSPFKGITTLEALRGSGMFAVWTPDDLIANADKVEDRGTFVFQPLVGGFPPEEGWKSLELLAQVIPKLNAMERGLA
jgi:alkanesulfonate monooxygenase SsuD/methylene tetrahydromethanopterin reductase-like flavin-dependent oxidoreductase (luciferase family)